MSALDEDIEAVFAEFRTALRSAIPGEQGERAVQAFDGALALQERRARRWTPHDGHWNIALPGVYQHYKGGLYTVVATPRHHESRRPYVLYVSHEYGSLNVRPLEGHPLDPDGFGDLIYPEENKVGCRRFTFMGAAGERKLAELLWEKGE